MRRPPDLRLLWPLLASDPWFLLSALVLAIVGASVATGGAVHPSAVGRAVAIPPLLFIHPQGIAGWFFPPFVATAFVLLADRLQKAGSIAERKRSWASRWCLCTLVLYAASLVAPLLSIPAWIYRMAGATEGAGMLPLSMLLVSPLLAGASSFVFGVLSLEAAMGSSLRLTFTPAVWGRVLGSFALWTVATMMLSPTRQDPVAYALGLCAAAAQLMLICSTMIALDTSDGPEAPRH